MSEYNKLYNNAGSDLSPSGGHRGRPRKYPWPEAKVGQGFRIQKGDEKNARASLFHWLRTDGKGQKWTIQLSAARENYVAVRVR